MHRAGLVAEAWHRMDALSKQDDHKMAAVQATRAILEPPPPSANATAPRMAGLVIVVGAPQDTAPAIDVTPQPTPDEA